MRPRKEIASIDQKTIASRDPIFIVCLSGAAQIRQRQDGQTEMVYLATTDRSAQNRTRVKMVYVWESVSIAPHRVNTATEMVVVYIQDLDVRQGRVLVK